MRYLISRQWSVLQDFDITGESGDLRYQVRGNLGLTQSLTITEPTGERTAQITRTPFTTWHQVIIDGQQVAEVRHQFLGWNNCTIDSASGPLVARGNFLGWQYTISQGEQVVATLAKQGILTRLFTDPASLRFGLPVDDTAFQRLDEALPSLGRGER